MSDETTKLYFYYTKETYDNNDAEDSDEPYSYRGTTESYWSFDDVLALEQTGFEYSRHVETILYPGKVEVGELMYVVVATYDGGDSFGRDYNYYHCVLIATKDEAKAKAIESAAFNHTDRSGDFTIKEDNGASYKFYIPWLGYFESLSDIQIITCAVHQKHPLFNN